MRKLILLFLCLVCGLSLQAQGVRHSYHGTIVDVDGIPLIGAAIMVNGNTSTGVITNFDGEFTIEASEGDILNVSCLGFAGQDIKTGSSELIDIVMLPDSEMLEQTVVVGYAPMRKSDFTGSIARMGANEIPASVAVAGQALVGKVAGVEVKQTSGAPGEGVKIRVRGVGSLSASNDPLYVIDGYPASEDVYLNSSDIESIDILKDAASAAIYGSRAASGVVLITTKRGRKGEKASITYDFNYGIQQLEHKVKLLNAAQFSDLYVDSRNNSYRMLATAAGVDWSPYDDNTVRSQKGFSLAQVGINPMFYDFSTASIRTPEYDTDWQDLLFSNAGTSRHNISIRGGSETVRYMASIGYLDQQGIISPSAHKRINARLNLDADINKYLSVSFSYSMYDAVNTKVQAEGRMINDGIIQSALMYLPNLPAYDAETGDYARSEMIRMRDEWGINFPENPLAIANELKIGEKTNRHNFNINIELKPIEDLTVSARLGSQWYSYRYNYFRPMSLGRDAMVAYSEELALYNIARSTSTMDIDRLGEFTASYKKGIGKHHFDALAGFTIQKKTYDRVGVEATGFSNDRIQEVTAHGPDPSDITLYSTNKAAWSMLSYLSRFNYAYDKKYTLTLSFRTDGSSRFGTANRWGYFPSVSGGWTLTEEPFMQPMARFMSARLRASWGVSGNNDIGNYDLIASISTGAYAIGNTAVPTSYEDSYADSGLGWETTRQTNLGADLGFLKDRVTLIANWYNSLTTDILYNYPISAISGSTSTKTNLSDAIIRNRGLDLQLDGRILQGEVNWKASFNATFNRNKVVDMGGLEDIISITERSTATHITTKDYPVGSFYGYKVIGVMSRTDFKNVLKDRDVYYSNGNSFPDGYVMQGPAVPSYALSDLSYGNTIYEDVNGDGVIDTEDKTIIGDAYPDLSGGLSTTVSWKGLELSAALTYSIGGEVVNFQSYYLNNMEGSANQFASVDRRYRSDEDPGYDNIPLAVRISTPNTSLKLSSYYVEDASFLRLSNVTLGYQFQEKLLEKLKVKALRVYASVDNAFTLTRYQGYNPEVSYKSSNLTPGFDWGCYPLARTWSIGLSVTL